MVKVVFTIIVLTCIFISALAQNKITGNIKDSIGQPIGYASVNLKNKEGTILKFTRTGDDGNFSFVITNEQVIYSLEISSIGYHKKVLIFNDTVKNYQIILETSEIKLAPVIVKNRPVLNSKGDTLSFTTKDFADKQDRSIGEVLRKMPGIDVSENGKISYNGKAISNLYIDGDNLLDDKYNIGTKSIPHGAVDKVQVIEKDQPVKMLRKNNTSDDVAINLVLNEDAKLKVLGDAKLGAGTPDRFDGALTTMLFKKKLKFINNLKGNNIGIDPAIDIISHQFNEYVKKLENNKPSSFLAASAAPIPMLPPSRSLFNKVGLVTLNNLYKFNEDLQLKANLYYLYDSQKQQFQKISETYLPGQTIRFAESLNNRINPQKVRAQFNLNGNSEIYFLNNTLIAEYIPFKTDAAFVINNQAGNQLLSQNTFDLSNELNFRKKFKSDQIVNFYSFFNRTVQPENLKVSPGLNEAIFNNGNAYAGLVQNIELPTLYTNNYFAFAITKNKFTQTYKSGFSLQSQQLNSNLIKVLDDNKSEILNSKAINNLNWIKSKIYSEILYEYENNKIKTGLNLPLSYNYIHYNDDSFALDNRLKRLFVNPALYIKYQLATEKYITASYSFKNELGGIEDIYQGSILRNYRSVFSNNAPISETKSHQIGTIFNLKKTMQMFFFNTGINYSKTISNTISAYNLSNNLQQRIIIFLENKTNNLALNANASKYVFNLRSTVNLGVNSNFNKYNQFQNNLLLPFKSKSITYKAGIESKITSFLNWSYQANYSFIVNKSISGAALSTNFKQLKQQSNVSLTMFKSTFLNFSAEHLFTQQSSQQNLNYLFPDVNMKYKLVKFKTDLEFAITNLANIKTFEAVYVSANSFSSGSYQIPGRVAMLKATFNF